VLFAVVGRPIPAYLTGAGIAAMSQIPPQILARPRLSGSLFIASALVAAALIGTGALWAYYGTAVFFETVRAGFSACFG
jgi:hypothetical protein